MRTCTLIDTSFIYSELNNNTKIHITPSQERTKGIKVIF